MFMPSLESLSSLEFEERNLGCPGNFAGMSRTRGGVPKVCAKKFLCIFRSLNQKCLTLSTAGNSMTSSEKHSPAKSSGNALEASNAFDYRVWERFWLRFAGALRFQATAI